MNDLRVPDDAGAEFTASLDGRDHDSVISLLTMEAIFTHLVHTEDNKVLTGH